MQPIQSSVGTVRRVNSVITPLIPQAWWIMLIWSPVNTTSRGASSAESARISITLPASRSIPWLTVPIPAEPPEMKPPMVAMSWVEGKIGNSRPWAISALFSARMLQPASTRTKSGPISTILPMAVVSMISPPSIGTDWP